MLVYVEIGVKGAGGCGGLDVLGSRALMLLLVVWLKHCFGVLIVAL